MDRATVFGLLVSIIAVLVSVFLEGGSPAALFNLPAMILILGGTIGATLIGAPFEEFIGLPRTIIGAFKGVKADPHKIIDHLVEMAEKARKEGLLALQDDVARIEDPLLASGINLIVDGIDPDVVRETLTTQVEMDQHKALAPVHLLEQAGGYAPTIGIMGTVMGLINVLKDLTDAAALGPHIATAFMATLYGIATANLFWLPMGVKVRNNVGMRTRMGRMIVAGVTGLQTGEAPRALREKLEIFLHDHGKKKEAAQAGAGEE